MRSFKPDIRVLCLFFIFTTAAIASAQQSIETIVNYYKALENHDLEKAYSISPKKVDYATFNSWYKTTALAIPHNFIMNSDGSVSFSVMYAEPKGKDLAYSYYNVTMQVANGKITSSISKSVDMEVQ